MRRYTDNTLMDRAAILALIERAAVTGYSIGYDELIINEVGISAPIRGGGGRTRAAIQCSVSGIHWNATAIEQRIIPPLMDAVNSF